MELKQLDEVTQKAKKLGLGTAVDCLKELRKHLDNPSKAFSKKIKLLIARSIILSSYEIGQEEAQNNKRYLWLGLKQDSGESNLPKGFSIEDAAVILLLASSFNEACQKFEYRKKDCVISFFLSLFFDFDFTSPLVSRMYSRSFMSFWEEELHSIDKVIK